MLFLLFLLLLVVSEWIFLLSIWSRPNAYLAAFGFLHLANILGSIGYIGFPGRIGIYPEITEFTLRRSK